MAALVGLACEYLTDGNVGPEIENRIRTLVDQLQGQADSFTYLSCVSLYAHLIVLQGRLHQSVKIYRQAHQDLHEATAQYGITPCLVGLADILRERNDLAGASALIEHAMQQIEHTMTVYADIVAGAFYCQARIAAAQAQFDDALEILDRFQRLAHARGYLPRLLAEAAAVKAELLLRKGAVLEAIWWKDHCGIELPLTRASFAQERVLLSYARVCTAQARIDDRGYGQEALQVLQCLLESAEQGQRGNSIIEILLLQALAWEAQENHQQALMCLRQAIARAEPEGYRRSFLDEGEPLRSLLRACAAQGSAIPFINRLLPASAAIRHSARTSPEDDLAPALTGREIQVLRLLSQGCTNAAIAEQLNIEISTVKRHLNNIYAKLRVSHRTQAISRARGLHLID
jgi:LuxR family maltose regulon positive regulatory protein